MLADILKYLPAIWSANSYIADIRKAVQSGTPIADVLATKAPQALALLRQIGAAVWPNLTPVHQTQAAAMAVYDQDYVKAVQRDLNKVMGSKLEADGYYGKETKAIAKAFQEKYGITPADGWVGPKTREVLTAQTTAKRA